MADDEDAEGDEDPEPTVARPAPAALSEDKTMSDEEWEVTDADERERRRGRENRKQPAPVPAKKKSRRVVETEEEEAEETGEEERRERRLKKGKGREVDAEPVAKDKPRPAGGDGRWKQPEVKATGIERDPPCKRCAKGNRTCLQQSGGLIACVDCAKVKMKCEPMNGEIRATRPPKPSRVIFRPGTLTQPTAAKRLAPKPTPGLSVLSKRPAPPATREPPKKRVKAPAPAPLASGSKRKSIKSPEMVPSSEESGEEESDPAPAATEQKSKSPILSAWPGGRRNFEEFEAFYGKFL